MERNGINERIIRILREQGLKTVELASALGVSANYITSLTTGRKRSVSVPLARLIETTLGYRAEWVLTGEEPIAVASALDALQDDAVGRIRKLDAADLRAVVAYMKTLNDTPVAGAKELNAPPSAIPPARFERPTNRPPDFEQRLYTLTPAEFRVYTLYAEGCTAGQIAERLGLSINTLKSHSRKIYKKLGINSRRDLFQAKGREGL
jgi:DNA-binding CsgD family transcriptional regulator/plasmid maintenance system antidote protein VapI